MATRLEHDKEQDARSVEEKQEQDGTEYDHGRSAAEDPNHQYGYGGFREDLLYKEGSMREGPHADPVPKGYRCSDEAIEEEANARLTNHGELDATEIDVSVEEGEITLRGTVDSRRSKRAAEDALETIPGVRDVHNRLRVQQPEPVKLGVSGEV